MENDELKELVAATSRTIDRLAALAESADRRRQEDDELRRREDDRWRTENDRQWEKLREASDRQWQKLREELYASRAENDRAMRSFHREMGRLGRKFGDYSESLAWPALTHALRERFHMTEIARRVSGYRNGTSIELDVFGHANDKVNQAYVAEVKTTLRQDGIDQILEHLRVFPDFFPAHRGKELYGILAAIEAPPEMQRKVLKQGMYLMLVSEDAFELCEPEGFQPRDFGAN